MRTCALLIAPCEPARVCPSVGGQGFAPVPTSGLPLPRYVSLKSDHVNVRAGPTKDNDVAWVYTRSGLAGRGHRGIRELAPHPRFRRRGRLGLSFAAVRPPHRGGDHQDQGRAWRRCSTAASRDSLLVAKLQAGVVAQVKRCSGGWCRVIGSGLRRLDRTAAAVGRLRRREGELNSRLSSQKKTAAENPRPFLFQRRAPIRFWLMSTSLVSGRKIAPMTTVIAAKMIGYQRPA